MNNQNKKLHIIVNAPGGDPFQKILGRAKIEWVLNSLGIYSLFPNITVFLRKTSLVGHEKSAAALARQCNALDCRLSFHFAEIGESLDDYIFDLPKPILSVSLDYIYFCNILDFINKVEVGDYSFGLLLGSDLAYELKENEGTLPYFVKEVEMDRIKSISSKQDMENFEKWYTNKYILK